MTALKNNITYKYVIALSIIAVLSTVAFLTLQSALNNSQSTGYIVNISGKQRMLSQLIALDIHRAHNHLINKKEAHIDSLDKYLLKEHTIEMRETNRILSTGNLENAKRVSLSPVIENMYFGEMNLAKRVEEYTRLADSILEIKDHALISELLKRIDETSEPLLVDLNKVVQQYQLEGEEKLKDMEVLETFAWLLTLFTLLLEVIFIFQPMVRKITSLSAENRAQIENLSKEVELRTIHLEKANSKLREIASHDPLTGLKNRLTLESDIDQAINSYKIHHAPFSVIMIDIDFFKKVNDTYGHDIGDFVLIEVSNILQSSLRGGDKVYRTGGEEFVILLNRVSFEESMAISEKIRLIIQENLFKNGDIELHTTISAGLYHSSNMTVDDVKTILKLIDSALYYSKHHGRNRITNVDENIAP